MPLDPAALLLAILAVPLLTAVVAWLSPGRGSERAQVIGSSALLVTGWSLASQVFRDGPLVLGGALYADALAALLVAVITLVGWAAAVYGVGYLRQDVADGHLTPDQPRWFALWYQLFLFTMLAAVLADNLGLQWVAIEATTLASALLVGFYRTDRAIEAAWKYLLICTVGITLALFGILLLYYSGVHAGGSEDAALSWRGLVAIAPRLDPSLTKLAFVFVLVGYGTKAGFAPMHTWLPDAHSQAPTPVSAVLSGVLLPCALYAILRVHTITAGALGPSFSGDLLVLFGVLSAAVAVPFILIQRDLKRFLAYSSIEHMGIIAVAVGIGGPVSLFAAALHLVGHALGKTLLFFAAGTLTRRYGTGAMARIRGAAGVAPLAAAGLLLGGLGLAGAPPSAVFTSELTLLGAGVARGHGVAVTALLACVALIFVGVLYHFSGMVLGRPPRVAAGPTFAQAPTREGRVGSALVAVPLAALAALGIVVPPPLADILRQAAAVLGGA